MIHDPIYPLALALAAVSCLSAALGIAYLRLNRRHRACRHALTEAVRKRDLDRRRPHVAAPWPESSRQIGASLRPVN